MLLRVGQWMSEEEYNLFINNDLIPRSNVLSCGKKGWMAQASTGDYYVEFDVNPNLLKLKNVELCWHTVIPNSLVYVKLYNKKGKVLPDPIGQNIQLIYIK